MLEILSTRQRELLNHLLKNKSGLTVDELANRLGITKNAVRQHLAALENDNLVQKALTRPSGGRPEQLYVLSNKGHECFPRQYSWFAQLLVESIQQESSEEKLGEQLTSMGVKVGEMLKRRHPELKTLEEKIQVLTELMEEIGYNTKNTTEHLPTNIIEADNCVFHSLAMNNPEICKFDLALLSSFTDNGLEHQSCMAKGENICRFKFKK